MVGETLYDEIVRIDSMTQHTRDRQRSHTELLHLIRNWSKLSPKDRQRIVAVVERRERSQLLQKPRNPR